MDLTKKTETTHPTGSVSKTFHMHRRNLFMMIMSHDVVILILHCNVLQVLFDLHQTEIVAEHGADF